MKNLHLGLVLIFIMLVMMCTKPVHADSDLIKILDVQVQPSTIKVNNTFSVSATILNNSTYPVYLTSGSCVPAFSVEFDSHSKQVYPDIACTLEAIEQRVDPNVETTISNVNKPGTIYKSIQAGTANANITIPYFIKNQTATDYSNIYYNATKSFSFIISDNNAKPQCCGPAYVTPIPDSPLKQFKSGVPASKVECKQGFQLVIKAEDGSPACVKPDTAQKLIERGWTKEVIANPIMSNQNSNQTVSVVSIKQVPPVTPGGPTIQLTLKNIGNMPITSLKVTLEVNKNYTFDFKDVTPTTPLVPNNSTSQTQILIGAGFQTDVQHPIIITGTENNTQFTYTENVYIQ